MCKTISAYPTEFRAALTYFRQQQELSMAALARKLDISEAYISLLESGKRQPSRKFIKRLLTTCQQDMPEGFAVHLLTLTGFELDLSSLPTDPLRTGNYRFKRFTAFVLSLIREHHYEQAYQEIQKGLQHFQKPLEINMLSGYLELTRGHYQQALVAMQAAWQISSLQLEADISSEFAPIEILANIGTVYFTMGSEQLSIRFSAQLEGDSTKVKTAREQAIQYFESSEKYLLQVLTEQPTHLYALDEYARLLFNLADLHTGKQSLSYWKQSISHYREVLQHPERFQMPQAHLWEAGCFIAHAYSKLKQFLQAREQLQLILSYQPTYWLAWYTLACSYNLSLKEEYNPQFILQGKAALKRAIELHPDAQSQAEIDPDLALLHDEDAFSETTGDTHA